MLCGYFTSSRGCDSSRLQLAEEEVIVVVVAEVVAIKKEAEAEAAAKVVVVEAVEGVVAVSVAVVGAEQNAYVCGGV